MASRPTFIDLQSRPSDPADLDTSVGRVASLPRWRFAGDTTPELSPLDAFAAHSRTLARQLQEGVNEGNLASATAGLDTSSLQQLEYFGTESNRGVSSHADLHQPLPVHKVEIEEPGFRPLSLHSRLGDARERQRGRSPTVRRADDQQLHGSVQAEQSQTDSRTLSSTTTLREDCSIRNEPQQHTTGQFAQSPVALPSSKMGKAVLICDDEARVLLPSDSSHEPGEGSSDPLYNNDRDIDGSALAKSVCFREPSRAERLPDHKTPSVRSLSIPPRFDNDQRLPAPTMNFSRPLSQASLAPESAWRRRSFERQSVDEHRETVQRNIVDIYGMDVSHTYPKIPFPRGKTLSRDYTSYHRTHLEDLIKEGKLVNNNDAFLDNTPDLSPPSHSPIPSSQPSPTESLEPCSRPPFDAASSSSYAIDGSAESHVAKGIACHEKGSLNESTYHLRLAAKMNHPTGMLLYALACRHGWGMRPNQKDGVLWLRRAADCAILEVVDDGHLTTGGSEIDVAVQRVHRAQFSLSVYELGVSHMNGWGTEQDKTLALRCFEIAGSWGDADALAEAGFCYAQGLGCKKDLKKSAKFYRMAESRGISMVGNSWIYKAKYADDSGIAESTKQKPRGKPRSRSIFGRTKTKS